MLKKLDLIGIRVLEIIFLEIIFSKFNVNLYGKACQNVSKC